VIDKSSRHQKIAGDFGENLTIYLLSKYGFEASMVDHTGIDIVAYNKKSVNRIGVSVKTRTRSEKRPEDGLLIKRDSYKKIISACEFFNAVPWFSIVIDQPSVNKSGTITLFLLNLDNLLKYYPNFKEGNDFTWSMVKKSMQRYEKDQSISIIKFHYDIKNWFKDSKI